MMADESLQKVWDAMMSQTSDQAKLSSMSREVRHRCCILPSEAELLRCVRRS